MSGQNAPQIVLFVDDESYILRAAARLADTETWDVLTAATKKEALERLEQNEVAVVVCDYHLGTDDGVEFLKEVRDRWPRLERILMTGQADESVLARAVNVAAISRFIRKPWNVPELKSALLDAIERIHLRGQNARLLEQLAAANDALTQRVDQTDRRLTMFEQRWETAFNAISEPVTIVAGDMRVVAANKAALKLSSRRVSPSEPCHRFLFRRDSPCNGCPITSAHTMSLDTTVGNQERIFEARAYLLSDEDGAHLCIYNDVTEEDRMRRHLAQTDKMAAVGRLASGMAHELNNPLHAIVAFAQLATRTDVEAKRTRHLQVIQENAERCGELIKAVKDYARRPTSSFGTFELASLARTVVEVFGALGDHEITVVSNGRVNAVGSRNQIQQVLTNLIQNALDVSPSGGEVRLTIDRTESGARLSVEDAGPGVARAERDRILEPFHTTKPEGRGTGLGLAICHSIIREHGGTLTIDGSPDLGGARFVVRLPGPPEEAS